jgi:hypothetical protein
MPVKNPDLFPLFQDLRKLLAPYEKHFSARRDEVGYYDLWGEYEVVVNDKKRDSIYFCGLIIQKSYVGFYFMPVYTHEEAAELFGAELMATLKGKSCFYIKELTPAIKRQIKEALKIGLELYKERGWA